MTDTRRTAVPSCDSCRDPGRCCREFVLVPSMFDRSNWRAEAAELAARHRFPFDPVAVYNAWDLRDDDERVRVLFACRALGPDGRCTIYESRPLLCRKYQPGEDRLCAEWRPTLGGIPIVVEPAA